MARRRQAGDEPGQHDHAGGSQGNPEIDARWPEGAAAAAGEAPGELQCSDARDDPQITCEAGEDERFGEDQADDGSRGGAERLSNAELPSPFFDADEHDITDSERPREQGSHTHDPDESTNPPKEVLRPLVLLGEVVRADGVRILWVHR